MKWSAVGSTVIMECSVPQFNTSDMLKRTWCYWKFSECTDKFSCWHTYIKEDNRIKLDRSNQSLGNFDLQISNVSMDDQGYYLCGCLGELYFYRLKIIGQPRFLEKDENNTLLGTEENNLTLTCVLEGGQSPEQLLLISDGLTVAYGGPKTLNYTFIPSRADHLTEYICIANNSEFDKPAVDRVTLYIRHIPDPPTIISSYTCTNISISWTPRASGNLPQVFYIEYKNVKSKIWERIGPINQTSTTEMTYQISEVSFDTFYEIRIFAENEIGRSIHSKVVRTRAYVIKNMTEVHFESKPVVLLQYWLVLGAVTVSLVLIGTLSHVCKYCETKNPRSAANNLQLQTLYEEIGSVQYQFISVAPVVPSHQPDSVQINSTSYEIEDENYVRGSLDNAEPDATFPVIESDQITSGQYYGKEVTILRNLQLHQPNASLEPEFDSQPSEDHTVNAENYENMYTPLRHDTPEDHHYSACRNSGVFQAQNTHFIVNNND